MTCLVKQGRIAVAVPLHGTLTLTFQSVNCGKMALNVVNIVKTPILKEAATWNYVECIKNHTHNKRRGSHNNRQKA